MIGCLCINIPSLCLLQASIYKPRVKTWRAPQTQRPYSQNKVVRWSLFFFLFSFSFGESYLEVLHILHRVSLKLLAEVKSSTTVSIFKCRFKHFPAHVQLLIVFNTNQFYAIGSYLRLYFSLVFFPFLDTILFVYFIFLILYLFSITKLLLTDSSTQSPWTVDAFSIFHPVCTFQIGLFFLNGPTLWLFLDRCHCLARLPWSSLARLIVN